jgi:hypothetical protein
MPPDAPSRETIVVRKGHGLPYSKGLMAQALSATALSQERAFELARLIEHRLDERGEPEIDVAALHGLAEEVLRAEEGELAAGATAAGAGSTGSTVRSWSSSAARPASASRRSPRCSPRAWASTG